jgi:hypothetical protein
MSDLPRQIAEALLDFDSPKRRLLSRRPQRAAPVIYKDRVVKDGTMICPHCNSEIHEKGTYSDDDLKTTRHRTCNARSSFGHPTTRP